MEHSSDLRAQNKVLTVARLYIEPTLPGRRKGERARE